VKAFAFRLTPGEDLKRGIIDFAERHGLWAPVLLTCVGSLTRVAVRLAGASEVLVREGKFEIVSLVGCADPPKGHLHLCVADETGATLGGHLTDGCVVYTTAEVILGELPGVTFHREPDPTTGYTELVVEGETPNQG
jgi:predicted DNA-binding protein with PD1-like motif